MSMKDHQDQYKKPSRWDKLPDENIKHHQYRNKHPEESWGSATIGMEDRVDSTRYRHEIQCDHHDRSTGIAKSNGKDNKYSYERKPKRISGYMRAWDDDDSLNERLDKHRHHRDRKKWDDPRYSKHNDGSKFSERSNTYSVSGTRHDRRENNIDGQSSGSGGRSHYRARNTVDEEPRSHGSHKGEKKQGHDVDGGYHRDNRHGSSGDERERIHRYRQDENRGRKRTRSETPRSRLSSRGKSSGSESDESSSRTKRNRSFSTDSSRSRGRSWNRSESKKEEKRASRKSSKRKYRHRSRSCSSSESRSSSEKRERKRKKKDKKRDKSKNKDRNKEERRSILTGKKIKLKVKKDKGDYERDANREELLQFLNAAYE